MMQSKENYSKTIKHLRGFGVDPEKVPTGGLLQSVEDAQTPLEAAIELVYYYKER